MRIVFEDENLQVIQAEGSSAYAIATFNTRDERANGRSFWGQALHTKYGISCFGFVSKSPNWYPATSMRAAAEAIRPLRSSPLIGYGHSMGGYASLKYSKLLDLAGAVASAPQISIDPADTGEDLRYARHFDQQLHRGMRIGSADLAGRLIIAYDPAFKQDRVHVEQIVALNPEMELVHLPHLMHRTVQALRPQAVLIPIFENIISKNSIKNQILEAKKARRSHPQYRIYLARRLLYSKRAPAAINILGQLPEDVNLHIKNERDFYLSRSYLQVNRVAEAITLMEKLATSSRNNAPYLIHLEKMRSKYPAAAPSNAAGPRTMVQAS